MSLNERDANESTDESDLTLDSVGLHDLLVQGVNGASENSNSELDVRLKLTEKPSDAADRGDSAVDKFKPQTPNNYETTNDGGGDEIRSSIIKRNDSGIVRKNLQIVTKKHLSLKSSEDNLTKDLSVTPTAPTRGEFGFVERRKRKSLCSEEELTAPVVHSKRLRSFPECESPTVKALKSATTFPITTPNTPTSLDNKSNYFLPNSDTPTNRSRSSPATNSTISVNRIFSLTKSFKRGEKSNNKLPETSKETVLNDPDIVRENKQDQIKDVSNTNSHEISSCSEGSGKSSAQSSKESLVASTSVSFNLPVSDLQNTPGATRVWKNPPVQSILFSPGISTPKTNQSQVNAKRNAKGETKLHTAVIKVQ